MEEATDKLKLPQGGISRVLFPGEYNHVKRRYSEKKNMKKIEKDKIKP